jgi:subtilase family serine protease
VNETGGSALPAADSGWSIEIALDVESAHAIAPGAQILLVEANSDQLGDLLAGVDYVRRQPGVVVVSMSWGGNEFSGETFTIPTSPLRPATSAARGWPAA